MSKSHAFIKPVRGKSLKDTGIKPVIEFTSVKAIDGPDFFLL